MQLLDCMIRICSAFFQSSWTILPASRQQWIRVHTCSIFLPAVCVVSVLDLGPSNRCGILAIYLFIPKTCLCLCEPNYTYPRDSVGMIEGSGSWLNTTCITPRLMLSGCGLSLIYWSHSRPVMTFVSNNNWHLFLLLSCSLDSVRFYKNKLWF